ncbi:unnamed protein product [Rotaria sp. Silwood2]|nr:unnamed protein product [Rotaria sp. Silwood2]CAF4039256.1 unnamed protein product [Rotaria sp. Silwood2]CAF4180437.1 unnamed protein product [Rotaria sp. Silwood2]CAF4334611.1 unnamed protein product [Rotaria sp. Silwood2]
MADHRNKHVMLSYQWDNKATVLEIYDALTAQGYTVWMDVKGGMRENLHASMEDGVENSWAVVCFLTQAYQDSKNCQAELTYAKEQRKNIIPVYMQSSWKPSGYLGIILAGAIYIKGSSSSTESLTTAIVEKLQMISSDQDIGNISYHGRLLHQFIAFSFSFLSS